MASRGLIVVTLNYRLGALGWLSLPALDEEAGGPSTNFALLDQQAALRWLHEHLPALGGDPSRLHLFGESAGAVNTIMHLVSPQSEGLFGSVGIMSGGTSTRSLSAAQAEATRAIASSPCADLAGRPLLTCLRALSPEAVDAVLPGEVYIGSPQVRGASSSFGPVVDGVVLPEAPLERIRGGRHHRVPVLLGTTAEEMAELLDTTSIRSQADLERAIRLAFRPVVGNTGVDRIVETYPASSYDSAADAYIALYSDFRFVCPATLLIEALAAAQGEPLYRYWFARRGAVGQRRIPASHGRELGYLFGGIHRIPFFTPQQEDREVGEQMERAWAAMAERGSPRTEGTPTWDAWEAGRDNAYVFDAPAAIMDGVRSSECTMWRSLLGL